MLGTVRKIETTSSALEDELRYLQEDLTKAMDNRDGWWESVKENRAISTI